MRINHNLNRNWTFIKKEGKLEEILAQTGETVNLPHTWNNLDGQDGGGDFARGAFWYTKELSLSKDPEKKYFLEFQGVSLIANVYVNGTHAVRHQGGFSTFRADITPLLKDGVNVIAVEADNRENELTYPQNADFTFFGGIYRSVTLIEVEATHFCLKHHGGSGFAVTPVLQADGSAEITLESWIANGEGIFVTYRLTDQEGNTVAVKDAPSEHTKVSVSLNTPHLWQGIDDPYLYTATASLMVNETVVDEISTRFGIRSYYVDPEKGFFLNGKPYPLHGVSRHQDRLDMGWAITQKEHREDMALIKEVGANSIRLAHYQHDQYFYDLCDEYGMVTWAEIPFISVFMDTKEAHDDTISQMTELVIQSYNHPAICFWGISNEITIGGDDNPQLLENLKELNALVKKLDPTRLTTIANVAMLPMDSEHNQLTDVLAYNHYFGWYFGDVEQNASWFDEFHKMHPNRCFGISEYGAEGILKWHSDHPQVRDYSEEYHALYHENMLRIFSERPYLWATYVWNMFDFAADNRDEGGVKGRNNKGLVTYDRTTRKDAFFAYKAHWSKEPVLHLCGKRYIDRAGETTTIKVYSNTSSVTLKVNGADFATLSCNKVFVFENVPLHMGKNTITAVSGDLTDTMELNRVAEPNIDYVLPNSGAGNNVTNWFDKAEELNLEFPEDAFSIKDSLKAILAHPEGEALMNRVMGQAAGTAGMGIGMLKMVSAMPLEKIFQLGGSRFTPELVQKINQALNKIKK